MKAYKNKNKVSPIRIAYVLPGSRPYGAGLAVLNSIVRLDRRLFTPYYISIDGGVLDERLHTIHIPIYRMPDLCKTSRLKYLPTLFKLASWLRTNGIDILDLTIHHWFSFSLFYFASRLAGTKLVLRNRSTAPWLSIIEKIWVSRVDFIISVSKGGIAPWFNPRVSDLWSKIKKEEVEVIADGRDMNELQSIQLRRERLDEFQILRSAKVIGMVGSINPNKRQDLFIRAASQIHRQMPDVRMMIVGCNTIIDQPKDYEDKLHKLVRDLGLEDKVTFTGYREDARELMKCFDALVVSSNVEGLSCVIIEAMGLGVPVVASKTGGTPDLIQHGVNGFLVEDKEPATYAGYLLRLLQNKGIGERFRIQSRSKLIHLDLATTTRREHEVYLRLMNRKPISKSRVTTTIPRKSSKMQQTRGRKLKGSHAL